MEATPIVCKSVFLLSMHLFVEVMKLISKV